jgi:cell division protein FtsL
MFAMVGVHALLTQNQFRLDGLQQQLAKVSARHQQLEGEVGQLAAPERIISAAEHELGLVLPASVTYVAPTTATTTPATSSPRTEGTTSPTTTSPTATSPTTTSRTRSAPRHRER